MFSSAVGWPIRLGVGVILDWLVFTLFQFKFHENQSWRNALETVSNNRNLTPQRFAGIFLCAQVLWECGAKDVLVNFSTVHLHYLASAALSALIVPLQVVRFIRHASRE